MPKVNVPGELELRLVVVDVSVKLDVSVEDEVSVEVDVSVEVVEGLDVSIPLEPRLDDRLELLSI